MNAAPAVKICGLTRAVDARAAAAAGAELAGVIFAPGRRTVDASHAALILADLSLTRVGVFVDAEPDVLLDVALSASLRVLQLHGDESPSYISAVRDRWDGKIWKALRPRHPDDFLRGVDLFGSLVDGLLLDGWSADARGGTGTSFPWERLAPVRSALPSAVSLIVAGGLTPENVGTAIELLRPDIVDVSSGVESAPGVKDPGAIDRFITAARQ